MSPRSFLFRAKLTILPRVFNLLTSDRHDSSTGITAKPQHSASPRKRVFTAPVSSEQRPAVRQKLKQPTQTHQRNNSNHDELSVLEDHHIGTGGGLEPTDQERQCGELRAEVDELNAKLNGKDREMQALKDSLRQAQLKISTTDRQQKELIKTTATQLHQQYATKHAAKVQALKQSYDRRYQDRISELETRNEELNREITSLHSDVDALTSQVTTLQQEVDHERDEKDALVSAYDQYFALQNSNPADA